MGFDRESDTLTMGVRVLEPEGSELPATMTRASLFVDDGGGGSCYNSDTDENIIEYFNLINYMGDFMIKVSSVSSDEYDVSIVCPEQESSDMPPDDFELSLETVEGNLSTECYSDTPLRIGKTDSDCSSDAECDMVVIASNKSTDKIYSQTEIEVTLKANLMTNPKLNPASLPICSSTAGPEPNER